MHQSMSDDELKEAMKVMAKFSGIVISAERIERNLPAFKAYMSDYDTIRRVKLAIEDEPAMVLHLPKKQAQKGRA